MPASLINYGAGQPMQPLPLLLKCVAFVVSCILHLPPYIRLSMRKPINNVIINVKQHFGPLPPAAVAN